MIVHEVASAAIAPELCALFMGCTLTKRIFKSLGGWVVRRFDEGKFDYAPSMILEGLRSLMGGGRVDWSRYGED